jgi:hypothetical protein
MAATSSTVAKRCRSEDGRACWKNSFSICAFDLFCRRAMDSTKVATPSESVGPGRMLLTVMPVPATDSAMLRGFRHAVVDHFGGNLDGGFAGDEKDAAPVLFAHAGEVVAGEADAAHDVDLEEAEPFGVGDLSEWFGIEDADVVDEDVGGGEGGDDGFGAGGAGEVGGDSGDVGVGNAGADSGDGVVDAGLGAAVDGDVRAFAGEGLGDGETDAGCRPGDESGFSCEPEIHGVSENLLSSLDSVGAGRTHRDLNQNNPTLLVQRTHQ